MKKLVLSVVLLSLFFYGNAWPFVTPQKVLPIPDTVSPDLQKAIAAGYADWWQLQPKTPEEWKKFQKERDDFGKQNLPLLLAAFSVKSVKEKIDGVPVFILEPDKIPAKNKDRVLLHLHGGGYVLNAGEAGLGEAVYMTGIAKFRVVSVDYRMPPDFPYPAALDDALKVYKTLLEKYPADRIGVFGTSTGGGMTLALMHLLKQENLPMPGAIAPGTPWSDLTKTGDSYFVNEKVDNVLVGYDGWLKAAAEVYANGHDMKNPLISPVYGEFSGFPPTILGSGTRDLFLSNTIRVHKKLLEANVPTELLVLEGLSHAQYMLLRPDSPETIFYFGQLARFFDKYLK